MVNNSLQLGADHLTVIGQQVDAFFKNLKNIMCTALYLAVLTDQIANLASD